MGYHSSISLSWKWDEGYPALVNESPDDQIEKAIEKFEELQYIVQEGYGKFRDWDAEIKEMSKLFPEVLFTLYGSGEDDTDLWVAYARNGKIQISEAEITYAPHDPALLK